MPTILFYLGSFLFLFFSRKRAKKRMKQMVQQTAADLIASLENALNLKSSGVEWQKSMVLKRYMIDKNESISLQTWIEICAFILLAYSFRSISIADKIAAGINHYHYAIIVGVFILLLTGNVMFEFLFAILVVFFSTLLLMLAVFTRFKTAVSIEAILKAAKIPLSINNGLCFYYFYKMLQAPGAAIQWVIDLFRPELPAQVNESQK
jgi:hypothetical protein